MLVFYFGLSQVNFSYIGCWVALQGKGTADKDLAGVWSPLGVEHYFQEGWEGGMEDCAL